MTLRTLGGTTTYFVGNIYESVGGVVTEYYYAGGSRVAMRQGAADPNYILTDHLGSTTVTTDASGNAVGELRYAPWGEVRYATGTTPTIYTYTGQYSNVSDFGLMFFNARWMDPSLGRFASADTIVSAGVQGLDRYAYASNNSVRYTDPGGHFVTEGEDCNQLSCSGDPDPGGVDRRRRDQEAFEQIVAQIELLVQLCMQTPGTVGCPPAPPASCYSSVLGINSDPPPGCYVSGYQQWEDWSSFDWWDAGVNALGIVGTGALLLGGVNAVGIVPALGFYEATQALGIAYDVWTVSTSGLSVDLALEIAAQNAELGRLVPVLGAGINLAHIQADLQEIRRLAPVYAPYHPMVPIP